MYINSFLLTSEVIFKCFLSRTIKCIIIDLLHKVGTSRCISETEGYFLILRLGNYWLRLGTSAFLLLMLTMIST